MSNQGLLAQYADQFQPYRGHGDLFFSGSKGFSGTVFRLPLRTVEQACQSRLSTRALSVPEAFDLLCQLQVSIDVYADILLYYFMFLR